jgi:signal transduction histidine kinase
VEAALAATVEATCGRLGWPVGHVWRVASETERLEPTPVWVLDDPDRYEPFRTATMATSWAFGEGLPGLVQRTRRPAWIADVGADSTVFPRAAAAQACGLRAAFGFPVLTGDRVAYVVELLGRDTTEPDAALHDLVEQVGEQLGRVIDRTHAIAARARADELERSNRELEAFAYSASHDLKAPLTAVHTYLQVLQRKHGEALGEDGTRVIGKAEDAVRRMAAMISGLLDYARVDVGPVAEAEVDVGAALAAALDDLRPAIERTGAEVRADALPRVRGDEVQLARVFQNLVGNALKFSGDAAPRVEIRARHLDGGTLRVDVVDHGLGFDPQQAGKLFVLFGRLPATEHVPGTGVGLAVTRRIIERHGGRIWATSTPGEGATFSFTLPCEDEPSP